MRKKYDKWLIARLLIIHNISLWLSHTHFWDALKIFFVRKFHPQSFYIFYLQIIYLKYKNNIHHGLHFNEVIYFMNLQAYLPYTRRKKKFESILNKYCIYNLFNWNLSIDIFSQVINYKKFWTCKGYTSYLPMRVAP